MQSSLEFARLHYGHSVKDQEVHLGAVWPFHDLLLWLLFQSGKASRYLRTWNPNQVCFKLNTTIKSLLQYIFKLQNWIKSVIYEQQVLLHSKTYSRCILMTRVSYCWSILHNLILKYARFKPFSLSSCTLPSFIHLIKELANRRVLSFAVI